MFTEFNWHEALTTSPISLVIVGCSVVMLGVAIERLLYYRRRNADPEAALERILGKLGVGDVTEATRVCQRCQHPLGTVALHVLRCQSREREPMEEQMQIALSQEKMLLERNIGILGTLAAVSPLIGLLGTVWGIMRAFGDMAITGSAAPSVVASGVAEALVTTAAGLIVAVPALMLFNYFTRRMNVMLTVADNHARSIRSAYVEAVRQGTQVRQSEHLDRDEQLPSGQIDHQPREATVPSPVR